MTTHCIHGFPTEQCVSCRECEHGRVASTCVTCRTASTARKAVEPTSDRSTRDHAGYEIFYEPAVSGWRYRSADAAPSALSYRSAFLARKAVDGLGDPAAAPPARAKRRKA